MDYIKTVPVNDTENVKVTTTTSTSRSYGMILRSAGAASATDQTLGIAAPAENTWDLLTAGSAIPLPGHIKFWDPRTSKIYRIPTLESVHDR